MERVTDGVYQVKKGFRAFVIDGDEGLTLIDTGLPNRSSAFAEGINSIGRSVKDITSIVLTHNHSDHAGSAAELTSQSEAAVYCSPNDARAVRGLERAPTPPFLDRTPLQILKPLMRLLPSADPVEVDHEIEVGTVLRLPEDLVAIATPGHTSGHMSFRLDRSGGILFVGDAAAHKSGAVKRGFFNRSTTDIDQSIREIAKLDFEIACFGHSDPIPQGAGAAFKEFAATL